jgi:hypothetical protein
MRIYLRHPDGGLHTAFWPGTLPCTPLRIHFLRNGARHVPSLGPILLPALTLCS